MDNDRHLLRVVGVVGDVREFGLEANARPTVYVHYLQRPGQAWNFAIVARGEGDVKSLIPAMRSAMQSLDRNVPTKFRTLDQIYSSSLDNRRFSLVIFGFFAAGALLLATLGIYGVTSYAVTQRTQEIGIRMALGAQRSDVLKLVVKGGMMLVLIGVAIGLAGAFAITRLMMTFLFGVTPTDAPTFATVSVGLIAVALVACLVPARRATKVDPLVALRYE